jgi:hypothetical protein
MPQLMRMTFHSASCRNFRWPYQAKVMKMLEKMRRITVHILALDACRMCRVAEQRRIRLRACAQVDVQ